MYFAGRSHVLTSFPFPLTSFPFPSFPLHEVTPQIQLVDFGSAELPSRGRGKTTCAATRHVPWALNTPNMRLPPSTGRKRILLYLDPIGQRV